MHCSKDIAKKWQMGHIKQLIWDFCNVSNTWMLLQLSKRMIKKSETKFAPSNETISMQTIFITQDTYDKFQFSCI